MANTNIVNGFRPVRYLSGAPYTGKVGKYVIPASDNTATFVGDLVKFSSAGMDTATGLACVVQAAASDACIGVIVGIEPLGGTSLGGDFMGTGSLSLDAPIYRAASTRRVVFVADDPDLLFEAQEDGVTDPLEEEDTGQNLNFVVAAGSTTTGASGMQLDSDSHGTSATLPLKLYGLVRRADNEFVTDGQAYTRWLVKINNHNLGQGTGSTGI